MGWHLFSIAESLKFEVIIEWLAFVDLGCSKHREIELCHGDQEEVATRIPFALDGLSVGECCHYGSTGEDYYLCCCQTCSELAIMSSWLSLERFLFLDPQTSVG